MANWIHCALILFSFGWSAILERKMSIQWTISYYFPIVLTINPNEFADSIPHKKHIDNNVDINYAKNQIKFHCILILLYYDFFIEVFEENKSFQHVGWYFRNLSGLKWNKTLFPIEIIKLCYTLWFGWTKRKMYR